MKIFRFRTYLLAVSWLVLCSTSTVRADFLISLGTELLLPNTANQTVSVFGSFVSSAANSSPNIGGLQLNVRLGDGLGEVGKAVVFQGAPAENSQTGIQFLGGTIWDGAEARDIVGSAPVDIDLANNNGPSDVFPQYGSMGIGFVSNANSRTLTVAPQLIARLVIDTTGFSGPVMITLDDPTLGTSFFLGTSDQDLSSFTNVVNRISAVPEPTSTLLFAAATGLGISLRKRKQSKLVVNDAMSK